MLPILVLRIRSTITSCGRAAAELATAATLSAIVVLAVGAPAHAQERRITFDRPELLSDRGTLFPTNPVFIEDGMWVEAFWAINIGKAESTFIRGHFHPADVSAGFEGQHFGERRELHGLLIKSVDGRPFWLKSLRYRLTRNRELQGQDRSIEGFSRVSVSILIGTSFTPVLSLRSQFSVFPVGQPLGNELNLPFETLYVTGFEFVTQVLIASTASVDLTDIVIHMH